MTKIRKFFAYVGSDGKRHRIDLWRTDLFDVLTPTEVRTGADGMLVISEPDLFRLDEREQQRLLVERHAAAAGAFRGACVLLKGWPEGDSHQAASLMVKNMEKSLKTIREQRDGWSFFGALKAGDDFFEYFDQFEAILVGKEGGRYSRDSWQYKVLRNGGKE